MKRFCFLTSLFMLCWFDSVILTAQVSQIPGGSFECTPHAFLFQGNPVGVFEIDLQTATSQEVCNDLFPGDTLQRINAVGFNPTDNYFWGYRLETNELIQIASNFDITLYPIEAIPDTMLFYSGDISQDGILYLLPHNDSLIWRIDLNPVSENYLSVLDPLPTTSAVISDWAISPFDGQLYAIASDYHLYRFNTTSGERNDIGEISAEGLHDTGHYGSAFFDSQGSFYFSHNQNGNLFKLAEPHFNNTSANWVGLVPFSSSNDGGMCPMELVNALEPEETKISIYPNPCNDFTNIQFPIADPVECMIYNSLGMLMSRGTGLTNSVLNTESWPCGLYFVCLLRDGIKISTERLEKR